MYGRVPATRADARHGEVRTARTHGDNRLMSHTSMSREFEHLVDAFGYTLDDIQWFTVNAMKSAFIPFDERLAMINDVIKPGYAALKSEWLFCQTAPTSGSSAHED